MRIQGSIGRQVRSKKTPILSFRPDEVIRSAEHIERVLQSTDILPDRPVSDDDPYVDAASLSDDDADEDDADDADGELDD